MDGVVGIRFANGLDGGAKIPPPLVFLGQLDLMDEDESEEGGFDGDADCLELAGVGMEVVVVLLDLVLEVEGKVDDAAELSVDVRGGGAIGALADGFEELLDLPVVDGFEVGGVGGAQYGVGDVFPEGFGDGLGDGFFHSDDGLYARVDAFGFVVGVGAGGDFGLIRRAGGGCEGFATREVFVVL